MTVWVRSGGAVTRRIFLEGTRRALARSRET
jgi:hypothetical protein